MSVTARALARMRASSARRLTDTVIVARTGVSVACRVAADAGAVHPEGAPDQIEQRRWAIVMPNGTDVHQDDALTVAGRGTYWVVETMQPRTYSTSAVALCYLLTDASGAATALNIGATLSVERLQPPVGGQKGRTRQVIASNIPARVRPVPAEVIDRDSLNSQQDLTQFTLYDIFISQHPLPDIQVGDDLIDATKTNPATGQFTHYRVDYVADYGTDHLTIRARKQYTRSST